MPQNHTSPPNITASHATDGLQHVASLFIELGLVVVGLSVLARLANRVGLTPIPLYLLAGLCFGVGGLHSLDNVKEFLTTSADIGVVMLLFMLGLEYNGEELLGALRRSIRAGLLNFALNFLPGLIGGFLLGWTPLGALLLGGVTYLTGSSIVAKVLGDLDRLGNRETPVILSLLVFEDLTMAIYLPLMAVLLLGQGPVAGALAMFVAMGTVGVVLFMAVRWGDRFSRVLAHTSDEVVLLSIFGLILLVAGVAQKLQVSSGIGAFLMGLALSGALAERAHNLIAPLRDLFASTFFFFVGLTINPGVLPKALPVALVLTLVTGASKVFTGWQAATWEGIGDRGKMRTGLSVVARGEFSIIIARLGADAEPRLAPVAAAYVLILAVSGPILARFSDNISDALEKRQEQQAQRKEQRAQLREQVRIQALEAANSDEPDR